MKLKFIISALILLLSVLSAMQAQEQKAQQQGSPGIQSFCPGAADDPRLNPAQKEMILKAGQDNPQHPSITGPDKRLAASEQEGEKSYGDANSKPDPASDAKAAAEIEKREKLSKEQQKEALIPETKPAGNDQPAGVQPKTVTNYRNQNGTNEQPQPVSSPKVMNFREMNGPNEQPNAIAPHK